MKRKSYSKDFKAKVALEALKGQKTANEIASEYGVHVSQINLWKKHLLDEAPGLFSRGRDREAVEQEVERDGLYRKIGRLQVEVDWLKKKTGHLG
jgi:transposase-like protein